MRTITSAADKWRGGTLMYRVMIVDDEQLIRITLKNMMDWQALDCAILALAKDGEEAWQIYQEAHPEIVITDLKMPKMDGIELIQRIKKDNPNTQIIALSNHSDFELVKEAMKAGAYDYLLKVTLEEEELAEAIKQVKERCRVEDNTINRRYESILEKLQHYLILRKSNHEVNPVEMNEILTCPLFDKFRGNYQLAYFRVDNINLYYQSKKGSHEMMKRNLHDIISETIPNFLHSQIVFISNHSGIILFQNKEKLRVLNTCNSIMRNVEQYMDMQLSITLSDIHQGLDDFSDVYDSVLESHEMRFYVGEGILIQVEELATFNRLHMDQVNFHTQILEAVSSRDFSRMKEINDAFMMYMKEAFIRPSDVLDYVVFIFNNIEGNELAKGVKTNFEFHDIISMVHQCETIDRLDKIMKQAFTMIEKWLLDSTSNRYRQDITDIIAYIEKNYTKKITLKMIADTFNINESYLSRMFKNETGKNLIYFINECKMRKARELLCDPKIMVKEAAYAVGIEDQFYFNKVFKKFYNVSPSDFRKRMSGKDEEKVDEKG